MQHKREGEEKTAELGNLFLSLDESGREKALNILHTLVRNQADTVSKDLKQQNERQTV